MRFTLLNIVMRKKCTIYLETQSMLFFLNKQQQQKHLLQQESHNKSGDMHIQPHLRTKLKTNDRNYGSFGSQKVLHVVQVLAFIMQPNLALL